MRDPLVRWMSAGLILALPVLIYLASVTSYAASPDEPRSLALAGVLGPVEAALGVGLWLASRERRRLGAMRGEARPFGLGREESRKS
jgi:hypothetical protein